MKNIIPEYILQKKHTLSMVLFFGALAYILISAVVIPLITKSTFFDFSIYNLATHRWFSGINPYQYPFGRDRADVPFNYPPASLLFLSLFTHFPFPVSQEIFTLFSIVAFTSSFFLLNTFLKPKIERDNLLIFIGVAMLTWPFKYTLYLGQINNFVLFFVIASLFFYTKKQNVFSAICLAIAACCKFYPILLLLVFIQKKDFKYIFLTLFFFFLLNFLIPSYFSLYFLKVFPNLLQSIPIIGPDNQSIMSMLRRVTDSYSITRVVSYGISFDILVGILFFNRKKPLIESFFLLFALLAITGQFSWIHHFIYLYPFLLVHFRKFHNLIGVVILLIFRYTTDGYPLLQNAFFHSYQTIGVLLLLSYVLFRYFRSQSIPDTQVNPTVAKRRTRQK